MNAAGKTSLTLFEHEAAEYNWTDQELEHLEKLSRLAGAEVLRATTSNRKRALKATQHIGVFCFGQTTVQVLPKMYRSYETEAEREREAVQNVLFLLHYALQLSVREHGVALLTEQPHDWFEGLISIFTRHLLEEWQHGPFRHYQEMRDTLPLLKGKLDVPAQLRHPESRHRFTVIYDEYTADVPLNRVFRFVVERLWHITRNEQNKLQLARLRQWMEEITLLPRMTVAQSQAIVLTRLNQRFASLLELARLFLDDGALQLAPGNISTYAFMLDMNQLFESFLTHFICCHRREILPASLQQCELRPQSIGSTRYLATDLTNSRQMFHLKPDLVMYDRERKCFPLLIDMKYKSLDSKSGANRISPGDFYQMFAYAHRYSCPRILLLYPQTADLPQPMKQAFKLQSDEKVIVAATVDLRQNLVRKEEQQRLKQTLKSLITPEVDR